VKRISENLVTSYKLMKLSDLRSNLTVVGVVCEMLSWERSLETAHKEQIINSRLRSDSVASSSLLVHRSEEACPS
jgi:hypothetical protein